MIGEKYKLSNAIQGPEGLILVIPGWEGREEEKVEASRHKGVNTWVTCTQTCSQDRPPSLRTVLTD